MATNKTEQQIAAVVAQLNDIEVFAQQEFSNLKAAVDNNLKIILQKAVAVFGTVPTEDDFIAICSSKIEHELGHVNVDALPVNWMVKMALKIIIAKEDSIIPPALKIGFNKIFGADWYKKLITFLTNSVNNIK